MFKTFHLGILKFNFLSLYGIENLNRISILPLKTASFWEQCSFGVMGKIGIANNFLHRFGKARENQSLIH
jgi:hypothetical protein